jgi:hypothetical protein
MFIGFHLLYYNRFLELSSKSINRKEELNTVERIEKSFKEEEWLYERFLSFSQSKINRHHFIY